MNNKMRLFHTAYQEIQKPDIHYGRKNADFGQGFYTSGDGEFAGRWAREKKGSDIIINSYELDTSALKVKELTRDETWFNYIYDNRHLKDDVYKEYDVIIGPIANDTLYNTFGIITSGFLSKEESLQLLLVGPIYNQIVLKTIKAAENLRFISSRILPGQEAASFKEELQKEEEDYQKEIAKIMDSWE